MVEDNLTKELLQALEHNFAAKLQQELAIEVARRYERRAKRLKIYKYERKYLERATMMRGPTANLDIFCRELIGNLGRELYDECTVGNLTAHYRLVRRNLIEKYLNLFLYRQFNAAFHDAAEKFVGRANYAGSYYGSWQGTIALIRGISRDLYQQVCEKLADKYLSRGVNDVEIDAALDAVPRAALRFEIQDNRLAYVVPEVPSTDWSRLLLDELREQASLVGQIGLRFSNKMPTLARCIQRYLRELQQDNPDLGKLFLYGGEIQGLITRRGDFVRTLIEQMAETPELAVDDFENLESFVLRHALLVMSAHEIQDLVDGYGKIRALSAEGASSVTMLKAFEKTVVQVSKSPDLFSESTVQLAVTILDTEKDDIDSQTRQAASAAVAQGSLAGIGRFARDIAKDVAKDTIKDAAKHDEVRAAILRFINKTGSQFAQIAADNPATMGWMAAVVRWCLRHFGGSP